MMQRGVAGVEPFPYWILDHHWSEARLRCIAEEFPPYHDARWRHYPMEQERGKKAGAEHMWGDFTRRWFDEIRAQPFVEWLQTLTGIDGLVADTLGGGMHCTGEGGRLGLHTDFSVHPQLPHLTRRINLLVFLNPVWEREWGGVLYLGKQKEVEVVPVLNRMCLFETSARSFHGHPDPIVGNHLRKSLACYYYAPRRPEDDLLGTTHWLEAA